jgi:hypothetical protein
MLTNRTKGEHFLSNEHNLGTNVSTLIVEVLTFQASSVAITKLGSLRPGENGKRTCQSKASEHCQVSPSLWDLLRCLSSLSHLPVSCLLSPARRICQQHKLIPLRVHVLVYQPISFTSTEPTWDICFQNSSSKIRDTCALRNACVFTFMIPDMSCHLLLVGKNNLRLCMHWMWDQTTVCPQGSTK